MDLSTRYLGLTLASPFMPGASPLSASLDGVRALEDAGAPAIVLPSLFEEQLGPVPRGVERYLEHLTQVRHHVHVPVIASLNGTTAAGWLDYARLIEHSGASALELNFYHVAADPLEEGWEVERRVVDIVAVLKESVGIPLAVKLSPFYSSLANVIAHLDRIGADGLVLFNRFYQPDIDPELQVLTGLPGLSEPSDLLLRLHWTALLAGRVRSSIAVSGGVHEPLDAVKAIMAGADGVQLVSALVRHGASHLALVTAGVERWGDDHGYRSIAEMRGAVKLGASESSAMERRSYVRILQDWNVSKEALRHGLRSLAGQPPEK